MTTSTQPGLYPADDGAIAAMSPERVRVLLDHHARFLAFIQRRVGRRDLAEEILQDAFVRGIDRGGSLRDGESAVAWFYRLLRNALVDHYRKADAERRALHTMATEPAPVDAQLDDALMQQVCACVVGLLDTLKPEYAEALRKVDLEGAPVADFASASGITANNASVRLYRAREALRQQLVRACGSCSVHACLDCNCSCTEKS